jgi:hypothetical protein
MKVMPGSSGGRIIPKMSELVVVKEAKELSEMKIIIGGPPKSHSLATQKPHRLLNQHLQIESIIR